jgi:hypothetical protein
MQQPFCAYHKSSRLISLRVFCLQYLPRIPDRTRKKVRLWCAKQQPELVTDLGICGRVLTPSHKHVTLRVCSSTDRYQSFGERWYPSIKLHGGFSQMTTIFTVTAWVPQISNTFLLLLHHRLSRSMSNVTLAFGFRRVLSRSCLYFPAYIALNVQRLEKMRQR